MHSVGDAFSISAAAILAAMVVTFIEKLLLAYFAESDRSFRVIVTDAGMLHG